MPLMRPTQTKPYTAILARCFSALSPHIQQSSLFYNMSQNHANPSLNSKCHFRQSRADSIMPFDATNPALFDALRSGNTMSQPASQSRERSTPQIPAGHNQTTQQDSDRGRSNYTGQAQGLKGISLWLERDPLPPLPTQPKLARLQNPETPLYLENLLFYLHKPLKYPVNTGM